MASDRARVSYDPSRGYRSLVLQQGRVSLEADGNEAGRIAEAALRQGIIDIVGPTGTPDDGYAVSIGPAGITVGPGYYYVGGWRVALEQAMPLGKGEDEADAAPVALSDGRYAIALLLTEQEISAVEDHALLEVALGGPDTCQRTRLMQRAVAIPVRGESCAGAAAQLQAAVVAEAATYVPATGAIEPAARLQVSLVTSPEPVDPCDPPASGGYLGADNQLIRVAVTAFDPATGKGRLVWGFDDASTLYRAATADGQVLTIQGEPVDGDHAPRLGQAVEVLRTRKLFGQGDLVAADAGLVTTVSQPYQPDERRVTIAATLPTGARGDAAHPLFLRLWEAEVDFARGTAVELGSTGLAVTLALTAPPGSIVARPFWTFAARPSTPVLVYPRRYLDAPQPPEGPRQWLAPLAVVAWGRRGAELLDDCRDVFLPLTKLRSGCCGITLDPEMIGRRDMIQGALDRLRGTRGTVTLRPGHYKLRQPIRLDSSHEGLTLEGCGEGVFLEAATEDDPAFAQGLIVLDGANEVALRSLQLQMPAVALKQDGLRALELGLARTEKGVGSIGISATACAQLTIAECQFRYRLHEEQAMFAVGLLARSECRGLRMMRNRFLHDIGYVKDAKAPRLLHGVVLVPALALAGGAPDVRRLSEARIDALLGDAEIADNQFVGLTVAVLVSARLGYVRMERNRVRGCSAGIYLLDAVLGTALRSAGQADRGDGIVPARELASAMTFAAATPASPRPATKIDGAGVLRAERAAQSRARALAGPVATGAVEPDKAPGPATADKEFLSALQRVSAAIESHFDALDPVVHLCGNDIAVFGQLAHDGLPAKVRRVPETNAKARGDRLFIGLQVVLGQREASVGDVLVTNNRIASQRNPAALIAWPQRLVFASNIVVGSGGKERGGALAIVTNTQQGEVEVMGNVVHRHARIQPSQRPQAPSQEWAFVNRLS